tara:strand:- start:104 stop:799 length:696 start_codon:yes stop_codon:yes gene_type:complete
MKTSTKNKEYQELNSARYLRERSQKNTRVEEALTTDKSTWKKCKHCGKIFPETNDFWVKNGKKSNGSQQYRTFCGENGNNCYILHGWSPRKKGKRNHKERMSSWRGQLNERKSTSYSADSFRVAKKIKNGIELTEFEKLLRDNVIREVHPLTIEILLNMLEKQDYKCAETGLPFTLDFPHLNNLSIDRKPDYEYHTPEGVQLVVQWYNKAVGDATREQRDILNEDIKKMGD